MNAWARWRRRLDRRFYRALFALYRRIFPTPVWSGPLPPERLRRVLVLRHDRIGDLIVTTPLLSLLHDALPHAEIDVLASPANAQLLDGDTRITRVFVADRSKRSWPALFRALRARRYDAVFSVTYGRGLEQGIIASLASRRTTYKLSVIRPARYAGLFTKNFRVPRSSAHMAHHLLLLGKRSLALPQLFGLVDTQRYPMRLTRDAPAEQRAGEFLRAHAIDQFVLANLSAAEPWRAWTVERCIDVLRQMLEQHASLAVVFAPLPGREAEVRAVAAACGPRVFVAPASPRFADVIALLRRARIVLTPDTSLIHVASATGRPVLGLYAGRAHNHLWQPLGVPYRAVLSRGREPVTAIPTDVILREFAALLAESDPA